MGTNQNNMKNYGEPATHCPEYETLIMGPKFRKSFFCPPFVIASLPYIWSWWRGFNCPILNPNWLSSCSTRGGGVPPPLCKICSRWPTALKLGELIAYIIFYKIWKFGNTGLGKKWHHYWHGKPSCLVDQTHLLLLFLFFSSESDRPNSLVYQATPHHYQKLWQNSDLQETKQIT